MSPTWMLEKYLLSGSFPMLTSYQFEHIMNGLAQSSAEDVKQCLVVVMAEQLRKYVESVESEARREVSARMKSNDLLNSLGFPSIYASSSSLKSSKK